MTTTSIHHRHPSLKHRRSIAALGLSVVIALAACGADAEPASRPVSPQQAEDHADAQTRKAVPWWADPARHPANQDLPAVEGEVHQLDNPSASPLGGTDTPAGDCLTRAIVVRC
jgi:hypothetical protein